MLNQTPIHKVISFKYVLKDDIGNIIDSSEGKSVSFLTGVQQLLPAVEQELLSMIIGQKKTIQIPAKDAYGEYNSAMVIDIPKNELSHLNIQIGTLLQVNPQEEHPYVMQVVKISEETVTLDGNHPLAGKNLEFDLELTDTRNATPEEIAHKHVHGPGGHQH